MIDVLWSIICYSGLVVLALAIIAVGLLLVCGIINIIKSAKEDFKK